MQAATSAPEPSVMTPIVEVAGVYAGYGRSEVLREVSLSVARGRITALIGANGAGKTTTLRVISGLLRPSRGTVHLAGSDVTRLPPHRRAAAGLCLIPEGRGIFKSLTVSENLMLAQPPGMVEPPAVDDALQMFPALSSKLKMPAGRLSGGQQQMLALSRAFLARPSVVLLDEVSMGLAPIVVDEIFAALQALAAHDTAILLVEQYVGKALSLADTVVVLEKGTVALSAAPSDLDEDLLFQRYLGADTPGDIL